MKGKACFPNATIQRVQIGVAYGMFPCMCTHTDECTKSSDPPITIPGRVCVCVCASILPLWRSYPVCYTHPHPLTHLAKVHICMF